MSLNPLEKSTFHHKECYQSMHSEFKTLNFLTNDCIVAFKTKQVFDMNKNLLFNRWVPPSVSTNGDTYVIDVNNYYQHYYVCSQKEISKKNYIDDYNQIQNILIQKFQFRRAEFKYNKGFNIIDHNTDHIYEIRILYAYYINQEKSIDDIKWRLYVDFLKMNVIASTFLLRKLMRSPYSNLLIKLCLKENVCDNNVVKSCIEKLSDVDNKKSVIPKLSSK